MTDNFHVGARGYPRAPLEFSPETAAQLRYLRELDPRARRRAWRTRLSVYAALALLLLVSLLLLVHSRTRLDEDLLALVREAAGRHGLDARFVEAVVRAESRGDPEAVSRAEAYGLMQLQVPTASELAGRDVTPDELFEPRFNLDLGCRYLRRLLSLYRGDVKLALMAYNAGPGNVRAWLSKASDPDAILKEHAFRETRAYVAKVLRYLAEE